MTAELLRIAIAGTSGRMGRILIEAVHHANDLVLAGALDQDDSPMIGQDAGLGLGIATSVFVKSDVTAVLRDADVLIDFTRPQGTLAHLNVAQKLGKALVIGTTGFTPEQKELITTASRKIPIVMAPNMSIGVNVMWKLLATAAKALGNQYDIEIIEAHHRHKVDAPSGTALKMGEVIAETLGRNLDHCAVYAREGFTGPRKANTIGFATVRAGDIVGDHTALFASEGERIEITHRSSSRATYAQGSLQAARFLKKQSKGLFDMFDVLGLKDA